MNVSVSVSDVVPACLYHCDDLDLGRHGDGRHGDVADHLSRQQWPLPHFLCQNHCWCNQANLKMIKYFTVDYFF